MTEREAWEIQMIQLEQIGVRSRDRDKSKRQNLEASCHFLNWTQIRSSNSVWKKYLGSTLSKL